MSVLKNSRKSVAETSRPHPVAYVPGSLQSRPREGVIALAPVRPLAHARIGYPIRSSSFATSVAVHCVGITLLLVLGSIPPAPKRPVYEEFIRPNETKLVFYRLQKKAPEVPDVQPVTRVGRSPQPRAREASRQTIIATSKRAQSKQQMIWLPAPKIEIHQDVPAPNLIERLNTSLPGPPRTQPRTFRPPPPANRTPRLPLPVPVLDSPSLSVSNSAPVPRPLQPGVPSLPAPAIPAPVTNPGNDKADIAIANLNPTDTPNALPAGARPGEFSKAPEVGEVSSGGKSSSALTVPDLTIRGEKPKPDAGPANTILYSDKLRSVPVSSFSVPLRPATRTIPGPIDARFHGRNVYTLAIPIENMPKYGGDWIIWFAERSPVAGDTPLIRAPIPYRKTEPVEESAAAKQTTERVQIVAFLGNDGKLDQISLLTRASSALSQAVIKDVMEWEFKPATRDGNPVGVEVVIEIPFNVPAP